MLGRAVQLIIVIEHSVIDKINEFVYTACAKQHVTQWLICALLYDPCDYELYYNRL